MSCSDKQRLKGTADEDEEDETESDPFRPTVQIEITSEQIIHLIATNLVCMARNRAEAYVVARGMADACKRFPAEAEYSADEVRCIADRVSQQIQRIQQIHMGAVCGRVDETDVPQLVDKGTALLNTMWLVCSRHVDMCIVTETVANLFERGMDRSSCENVRYKRIVGALAEGLVVYLKECMGLSVKVMCEHKQENRHGTAMHRQGSIFQKSPNSQENKMYG